MRVARRRTTPGAGRRPRTALLASLALALALPLTAAGGAAASSAPPTDAPSAEPTEEPGTPDGGSEGRPVTATYTNPLMPEVPGGGTVDSCADPTVLRGQEEGSKTWFMYCTTDPLNDEDLGEDGGDEGTEPDLVFQRIPQMVSTDLVNWTYVGNALPTGTEIPAWIDPTSAFWAPEVAYNSTQDTYYMFLTVTQTTAAGGGSDECPNDSAIGVATSKSPLGPWVISDAPVVAPRVDPNSDPNAECRPYLWTFDPDVLGDTVEGDTGTFYYGSYYGGIFGTDVTFTADGATTGEQSAHTMISIGNRYEGANVVEKDGAHYLFGSATNCCNGALTGYSVFVGRSTEGPLGPFLDREGNSLLDTQVGGTPFLTMNGNRWIGTGHNTVFQDAGGQWWTIYHAVDQEDPFYATSPGFTKRPALLDPVDWVDGWPTVNGGRFASDTEMPAPAGQEGERSLHVAPTVVAPHVPGVALRSDEFDGKRLRGWDWVREDAASTELVDGVLEFEVQQADLFVDSNNASVLLRRAPAEGDYMVETRMRIAGLPNEGCCHNFVQGGLVVYGDDDNFIKLVNASIWETRQTEFAKELNPVPGPGYSRYGNTVVGPPSEYSEDTWTYLRIVVEHLDEDEQEVAGGDTERYTSYTSQDGETWVRGGAWTHSLGDARIGLVSMAAPAPDTYTSEFDYFRVFSLEGGTGS